MLVRLTREAAQISIRRRVKGEGRHSPGLSFPTCNVRGRLTTSCGQVKELYLGTTGILYVKDGLTQGLRRWGVNLTSVCRVKE